MLYCVYLGKEDFMSKEHYYIAIDLKSFYASVECVERGLDPLDANLVVADPSRTEKTICLAVSPALKAYGIGGRARLFEVVQKVRKINADRSYSAPKHTFTGKSASDRELKSNPALELDYIVAPPQMAHYMDVSTQIYNIYLRYIAPEDIHVYSIDEVFIDAVPYLKTYKVTPRGLAMMLIKAVLAETGITATAGVGTNLYLCKVAMDIVAKHIPPDENGVRIAELDEMSYRRQLWNHRPLTDFWRVGRGYAAKLEAKGLYTMGDIARCSLGGKGDYYSEDMLYKLFGVNAELLIDHAWGFESCTIAHIKAYRPESSSLTSGQVLQTPYTFEKGLLVIREMTELLTLDMVEKGVVADQLVLTVGYDNEGAENYSGETVLDPYGRSIPKSSHGSANLGRFTSSTRTIVEAAAELYKGIVNRNLLIRRMTVVANHVVSERSVKEEPKQLDFFSDYTEFDEEQSKLEQRESRERNVQKAIIGIKHKYGKNSVLKGMNLEEGATTVMRNGQVGGHKA